MAITNLKQGDARWGSHYFAGENLRVAGCGPTATADLLGHGTPVNVGDWLDANGYTSNGSGTYASGIPAALKAFGADGDWFTPKSLAGTMQSEYFEKFKAHIQNGYCGVILFGGLSTGCRTSYWANAGHYVAIVGYSDGKYLAYDPAWDARDGYHDWDSDIAGNVKHLITSTIKWTKRSDAIKVDGWWGEKTTKLAQKIFKTTQDGIISNQNKDRIPWLQNCQMPSWEFVAAKKLKGGSALIRAIQKKIGVAADGFMGDGTTRALQTYLGVGADGLFGPASVKAFQAWLNNQ